MTGRAFSQVQLLGLPVTCTWHDSQASMVACNARTQHMVCDKTSTLVNLAGCRV